MNVPHDRDAERALLASMLLSSSGAEVAERQVDATDFYVPAHQRLFDAIVGLRAEGVKPDATLVMDRVRADGSVPADVVLEVASFPASSSSTAKYASIVVGHAVRRKLIAAAQELVEDARTGDPDVVLDAHVARLEAIDLPGSTTAGLGLIDELLDRPDEQRAPWVVPGLLRRDWRCVVVATEGAGKTLMLQQIALCASQGVHPFMFRTGYRPVTTLLVDAENPDDRIQDGCKPIRDVVTRMNGGWDQRTYLWHRPGGLDLRSRRDVAAFEDVLYRVRPELVCAGPSYKLAERGPNEGWDEPARAVQTVLDKLRTRFGFALLLEDHAPQSTGGAARDLRPFGSSMWLRWPELGIKLIRESDDPSANVRVGHWRGARLKHSWPDELHRGDVNSLPWVGFWREGMDN